MSLREIIFGKPPGKSAEVTLTRPVRVKVSTGELLDGQPGETYQVSPKDAEGLLAAGAATVKPSDDQEAERDRRERELAELVPGPVEPDPMPKNLADLPAPFHDWWTHRERRRCLGVRSQRIAERFSREWAGIGQADANLANLNKVGDRAKQRAIVGTLAEIRVRVLTDDPRRMKRIQHLQDALYRSWTDLDDFDERGRDDLWRAKLTAGDLVIEQHGRLTKIVRELFNTGLDIYRSRIGVLCLEEKEVRRLFRESTLAASFIHAEPSLPNLRLAWTDSDGARFYLDSPIAATATLYRRFKDEADRLEADLKSARVELKKALAIETKKTA